MFNYAKPKCNVKCLFFIENKHDNTLANKYTIVSDNLCKTSSSKPEYCTTHCFFPEHNHCTNTNCDVSENICFKSLSVCAKHCELSGHNHCKHKNCDSFVNICDSTSSCRKIHCEDLSHSHCVFSKCDSTKNICENTGKCLKHK